MDSLTLDLPSSQPILTPSLSSLIATLSPQPNSKLKREEILDWTHTCDPPGVLDLMRNSSSSIYRLPSQQPALITTISSAAQPIISSNHDIIRHDEFISHDHLLPPLSTSMLRYDSKWNTSLYKQHSYTYTYTLPSMSLSTCTSTSTSATSFTSSFTSTSTSHPIHRPSFEASIQDKVQHAISLANESSHESFLSSHTSHITSSPYRGVVKHDSDDSDDDMQQQQQQQHTKKRKRIIEHDDEDPDYDEKYVDDAEDDIDSHDSHSCNSSSPLHTSTSAPQHIRIRTSEDSAHHRRRQSSTKYKRTHKKVQRGQQLILKSAENRPNYRVAVAKVYYGKWCVRLVTATDTATQQLYRFVHGPDVAGLVKRKSNISRLLGQYTSPDQKMIMNVPSARCPNTGQPSNVLTIAGLDRLIREEIVHHDREYAKWLLSICIPFLNGETVYDME